MNEVHEMHKVHGDEIIATHKYWAYCTLCTMQVLLMDIPVQKVREVHEVAT